MPSYYVHFMDDVPVKTHGPYALKAAKDFARIGSQFGGRRQVTRGRVGPVVRVYERGHRRWPVSAKEIRAAKLRPAERPSETAPRLPPALRAAWGQSPSPRANPTASATFPGPWSRSDSPELQELMASVIWTNALSTYATYAAEEASADGQPWPFGAVRQIVDELADNVPRVAVTDAAHYLNTLKRANGGRPWWDVANELGVEDLAEFAYYVVMQTEGAGVTWSDDHAERLITGHDEAVQTSGPAESRVRRLVAREYAVEENPAEAELPLLEQLGLNRWAYWLGVNWATETQHTPQTLAAMAQPELARRGLSSPHYREQFLQGVRAARTGRQSPRRGSW